ncbi:uncharacterized protein PV09_00594 [Verruconis gallopava]|uniref:UBC core domain-containing protein n=1 Tax=Verruconis gallopava TaxID=253628 RepID=A0A0D2APL9_9PEZI|nr:uncharacterized protein PV09_00594 [Verruconis gallopava]KIW08638.1 hypothetical protein PV09_00594 [Verruconis gallopava]
MDSYNGKPPEVVALLQTAVRELTERPVDAFYTEDMCDMRYEPGHIGVVERTTADVDTHEPHPHLDYDVLRCHKDIGREAFRKFKHDGIPPAGTVLVSWQTKKYTELVPTNQLTLTDRSLLVGDVVKKDPKDAMSGTVKQTSMSLVICPSAFKESRLVNGTLQAPLDHAIPFQVSAEDMKFASDYKEGDLVIYKGWIGRVEETLNDVLVRLPNASIVAVDNPAECINTLDPNDTVLDIGVIVRTGKSNIRRGRWIVGHYDSNVEPIGDVVHIENRAFYARWLWKYGSIKQQSFDRSDEPPARLEISVFEAGGGKVYDRSRSPRTAVGMNRSHIPFISGDKVRFRDVAGAAIKYPSFNPTRPSETHNFDMNVFTVLLTKTNAKIAWQDQTEEELPGTAVVPDYNMEDDNEVWPGEIVITNETADTVEEDWIFRPKRVGVVQSVSPADRIAHVKWLPEAKVLYNQVGLDEHLDELSLLEGSTLGLDLVPDAERPEEDVTLYDIRTIGGLSRRRGDFVVIGERSGQFDINSGTGDDLRWFGEVIDLNLDGTLTVRLGAAEEVVDVRIPPETTTLVYSSDSPSLLGDPPTFDDPYNSADEHDSDNLESDEDVSEEETWMVDGEPVEEDDEWDTETEGPEDNDVDMEDASPTSAENSATSLVSPKDDTSEKPGDATVNLGIALQESSVKIQDAIDAPPSFDVLECELPANHPYKYPDPAPLTTARMKRIRKEHAILSSSLPEGIFVRTWESRLDLLRVLIVGPLGTPYEYAPFLIDIRIPPEYPSEPPNTYFHSWTSGQGPVNPNLYENGKICLSLLGTWHAGEKGEAWSASRSTILQVLVSILGLVLVKEPYYNEAGFEARAGSEDAKVPSQLYSERTYFRSRAFITYALRNGVDGFDDLLNWLYRSRNAQAPRLLEKAIGAAKELIAAGETAEDIRAGLKKMSKGAIIMLERQLKELEMENAKNSSESS